MCIHLLVVEFLPFYSFELVDKIVQIVYIPIVCLFPVSTNRKVLSFECAYIIFLICQLFLRLSMCTFPIVTSYICEALLLGVHT